MAEKSGFFDAHLVNGEYDRTYLAESFAKYFASFIGNGIFGGKSNELMVQQKVTADMSIRILSGQAWINGYWYENDDELSLAIDVADGVLNRIDAVVLRFNNSERVIRMAIKKGTSATNPSVPIVQRSADFYELKIAQVYVKAGATKITQADITDTRLDTEVCGFVHGVIEQFDTTYFGKQIDSFIENFEASNIEKMQEIFDRINALIDADMATRLTLDVEDLLSDSLITKQTLGYQNKNLIAFPYRDGMVKVIDGVTYVVDEDGVVTANGTPTSGSSIFQLSNIKLDTSKKYIITDDADSSQERYYTQLYSADATRLPATNANSDVEFTPEDVTYTARIVIKTTVSNVVFRPMVRRAEIRDNTWSPYTKSVKKRLDEFAIEDHDEPGCFYRINKQTGVKEWINPPLRPGWWYPLTERWEGKPVYQMSIYTASLPVNSAMLIQAPADWNQIVSISGYAYDRDDLTYYPFPIILHSQVTPLAVISRVEGDGSLIITTNGDASHFEAVIIIKYLRE